MQHKEAVEIILKDAGVEHIATEEDKQKISDAITSFNEEAEAFRDYNGLAGVYLLELFGVTIQDRQEATNKYIREVVERIKGRV